MNKAEKDKIQGEIKQLLKEDECALGYLVAHLNYSYNQILQNVLELKQKGEILKKTGHKGFFSLEKI